MIMTVVRNDQGILFVQVGVEVKNRQEFEALCKSNGEDAVDFLEVQASNPSEGLLQGAVEVICNNSEGLGGVIEQLLTATYEAGLEKGRHGG